ncbi:GNAT family N-acetyltransferase [Streptomyces sp. NPDC020807]|uniref:GNAT family N-acetyltransferase n=1 Tax=Streptomyces sp. NPDC020807 TaxID=3155119 RepID=UPI0033E6E39E
MKIESVATGRLLLHPVTVDAAQRIVAREPGEGDRWGEAYPQDGDVRACTGFLRGVAERGEPGVYRPYEIRLDGVVVGGIGFHGPPDADGVATVGYGLVPAVRGKGYASESLRALIGIARRAGASGVRGDADLTNPDSHRVMEAAGMPCVGEDETLRYFEVRFADSAL